MVPANTEREQVRLPGQPWAELELADPLGQEMESLAAQRAILQERLAAAQALADEREERIADLRNALFIVHGQPLGGPQPAAPPLGRGLFRRDPRMNAAASGPIDRTWDREAEQEPPPWRETYDWLPPPPLWMRLRRPRRRQGD